MPYLRPLLLILLLTGSARAQLTWSLASGNESWPADKRAAIVAAMDAAVALYNANGYFPKTLWANYNASVPTAQASSSGWIDFGGSIGTRVALHEISHTLGVGTVSQWDTKVVSGKWTGTFAINRVKLFDGPAATVGCDGTHFWPYGLNYDTEDGTTNRVRHIKMVSALRRDMGIVTDSDSDGIPNDWEMFYFGDLTQTATGDADGDGDNNLAEYNADTNPAAATTQWTGTTSSDWTVSSNWTPTTAPSNGTFYTRLNVNNNANNPLIYDATLGTTIFRPADRGLVIGSGANNADTTGTVNITGGSFSTIGAKSPDIIGNGQGNSGSLTIDTGSFASDDVQLGVAGQGTGTLTLNSGSATITALTFNFASGGTGTVNLNGGTFTTSSISRSGTGTGTLKLNGATLRASASSPSFLEGLSSTLIKTNGVTIDTSSYAITINQALLNDSSSPGGGITKSGSGTLTLGGPNTHTGPTQITSGTLETAHANALGTTTAGVTVANSATLALSNNISTPAAEAATIAGVGADNRGALQSDSGSNTWSGPVSVTATGTRIGVQDGASLTVAGNITESTASTSLIFRAGLNSGNDIILSAPGNAWTGTTNLFSGSATGGAVKLGATNTLPTATLFQVAGPGVSGRLDLNGFDQTAIGLTHSTSGSSAIGDGIVTNTAATPSILTLNLPASTTREFIGAIQNGSGGIQLVKQGNGTQILSGTNTYAAGTTITAGTLRQGVANAFGSTSAPLTLTGGAANLNGLSLGIGSLHGNAGTIANNASATEAMLTLGNGNASGGGHSGTIADRTTGTGTLALTKTGTGSQTLSGNNTFSGTTSINAGTLTAASNTALGNTSGPTTVASAAAIRLADGVTISGETLTLSGSGTSFNGALQAAGNASATWSGPVILGDAAARIGAMPGGTLTVSGPVSGSGSFQSLTIGAGTGGTASVILSAPQGSSTYTGTTAIIRGTLKLGAPNTLPVTTILDIDSANAAEDATLDLNGHPQTAAGLQRTNTSGGTGAAIVTNTHATPAVLTLAQDSASTFSGRVTGNLSLVKSGAGTLNLTSSSNAYSGNTTVTAGTLALSSAFLADTSAVAITSGAMLALNFSGSDTIFSLTLGGAPMPAGTYSAVTHPSFFQGSGSLTIPTPLSYWIDTFPGLSLSDKLPTADPDNDGLTNLAEFAFGGDPTSPTDNGQRQLRTIDSDANGQPDLTLTLEVRSGTTFPPAGPALVSSPIDGITYRIEGSTDLASFTNPVAEITPHLGTGSPRSGYTFKTFHLAASNGLVGQGFLRAMAVQP